MQATYLNACRSLLSGFEPEVAQAWLFKVAHNVCLTRQRSTWRRRRVERPEDIQPLTRYRLSDMQEATLALYQEIVGQPLRRRSDR